MTDLKKKYQNEVIPAMKKTFGYKNDFTVPKLEKVVVNTGTGKWREDIKIVEQIEKDLTLITGQKLQPTQAKNAIASFKTRKGMKIGFKVTLRGKRMYDFLTRLVNLAIPRTRDFRGINSGAVDSCGNLNLGVKEHIIFPEISSEDVKNIFGFEVTVVTTAKNKKEALELFKLLGFPLRSAEFEPKSASEA